MDADVAGKQLLRQLSKGRLLARSGPSLSVSAQVSPQQQRPSAAGGRGRRVGLLQASRSARGLTASATPPPLPVSRLGAPSPGSAASTAAAAFPTFALLVEAVGGTLPSVETLTSAPFLKLARTALAEVTSQVGRPPPLLSHHPRSASASGPALRSESLRLRALSGHLGSSQGRFGSARAVAPVAGAGASSKRSATAVRPAPPPPTPTALARADSLRRPDGSPPARARLRRLSSGPQPPPTKTVLSPTASSDAAGARRSHRRSLSPRVSIGSDATATEASARTAAASPGLSSPVHRGVGRPTPGSHRTPGVSWKTLGTWDCDPTVVLDSGSDRLKAGFAGYPTAEVSVPSSSSVGADASFRSRVRLYSTAGGHSSGVRRPIQHGIIEDWTGVEQLWWHTLTNQLAVTPADHALALTCPPTMTAAERARALELVFESIGVRGVTLLPTSVCGVWGTNFIAPEGLPPTPSCMAGCSGLSIDIGQDCSWVSPVISGFSMMSACQTVCVGGDEVTSHLDRLLLTSGVTLPSRSEHRSQVREIKEAACEVASSFAAANTGSFGVKSVRTRCGGIVELSRERFLAPEVLFQPSLGSESGPGIVDAAASALAALPGVDMQLAAASRIVVTGGTSALPGLTARIQRDLEALVPGIRVHSAGKDGGGDAVFAGAAIAASRPTTVFVTSEEYAESGPTLAETAFVG